MGRELVELKACLASLQNMISRTERLIEEYDRRVLRAGDAAVPVRSLQNAISYPEVRSLDLLCKDALERNLSSNPTLAEKWYVHENDGIGTPEGVHSDLVRKRAILQHAVNLLQAAEQSVGIHLGLPQGYEKLADAVRRFFEDAQRGCSDYNRNVFIMIRFEEGNRTLTEIDSEVRATLERRGLVGHRADDRCYPSDRNLWDNVCTYMICCKYGIAILEDIIESEFNPNVALEYGFMRALGKPTLLLKERRFKPRADILGTLWNEFDVLDLESLGPAVSAWIDELGVAVET